MRGPARWPGGWGRRGCGACCLAGTGRGIPPTWRATPASTPPWTHTLSRGKRPKMGRCANKPVRCLLMQSPLVPSEMELLDRLRAGDERAFVYLVERYSDSMLRVASAYVPSRAVAEEVVQDTWLAVLRGLDKFQGRSSLRTWLFTILVNRARTTGTREHRSFPIADTTPVVDASRFGPDGSWTAPPEQWVEE